MKDIKIEIPKDVKYIIDTLINSSHEAYIVGGCVRDFILGREPKDWDITTNALPLDTIELFKANGFNVIETGLKHGTVTVMINGEGFEITTFRIDSESSDSRHPDSVTFTNSLKEDLSRRDFTINALAYNEKTGLIDYFNGLEDLKSKVIRCVGNAEDRFNEDSLRMLRAVRFSCQLNFEIEDATKCALATNPRRLTLLSAERVREELCKILISDNVYFGIKQLHYLDMLKYIIPELEECYGFEQHNKHHDKTVFGHILSVLENTPAKLELRLSALLHDIGKPKCFTIGEDRQGHFLQHHKHSADMSRKILTRLKFDNKTIDKVCVLVYEHMNRYDFLRTKNTKKFMNRVGVDNLDDLFELQIADIKGSAKEYQDFSNVLILKRDCEKILNEKQPLAIKDLDINGNDLIQLGVKKGKEIGIILNQLLEMILDNSELNIKDKLAEIVKTNCISC